MKKMEREEDRGVEEGQGEEGQRGVVTEGEGL